MSQKTHKNNKTSTNQKMNTIHGSAKKRRTLKSKVKSNVKINDAKKLKIVKFFIEILNNVKLYHWRTKSYAQHKATDELYEKLNKDIDSFVEVMLGKDESRVKHLEKEVIVLDFSNK